MDTRWYHRIGLGDFCDSLDEFAIKLFPGLFEEESIQLIEFKGLVVLEGAILLVTVATACATVWSMLLRTLRQEQYLRAEHENRGAKLHSFVNCWAVAKYANAMLSRVHPWNQAQVGASRSDANLDVLALKDKTESQENASETNEDEETMTAQDNLDRINKYLAFIDMVPITFDDMRIFNMLVVDDLTDNLHTDDALCIRKFISYYKIMHNTDEYFSTTEESSEYSCSEEEREHPEQSSDSTNNF